jgi:hypothetical protein
MNAGIEPAGIQSIVDRAKAIILKPKDEWPKIASETKSQGEILTGYVLPLAAIGPVATFIGGQVFGHGALFVTIRPSLMSGLTTAVMSFVLFVVGVFILSLIADFLAPKFGGQSNRLNAFKLVAYGATATCLAGIFGLVPALSLFGLLGLYSIYLFYTGAGPMMAVPENQQVAFTAVTFVCAIVLNILVGFVVAAFVAMVGLGAIGADAIRDATGANGEVEINIPGMGRIESGDVEQMQKQVEDAVSGKVKPLGLDELKQLMPESIGSYERVAIKATSAGNFGSSGEGTYRSGDNQFNLKVTDMAAAGAIAGIAGQLQTEKWDNTSKRGKISKVVASRFMIEADGSADSIDQLKAAVDSIDEGDLKDAAE